MALQDKLKQSIIKYLYFLLSIVVLFVSFGFFQLDFFRNVNSLFTDLVRGETVVRNEIVIVGIDDQSLGEIGSWPWNRDIFAQALSNISRDKPSVVGIDVLFLEERAGDSEMKAFLTNTTTPIVFGSKIIENESLKSIYSNEPNSFSGFVNFEPDPDGKIRRSLVFQNTEDGCELNLATALVSKYFQIKDNSSLCQSTLEFRGDSYSLTKDNTLQFAYTKSNFQYVSFKDVLAGKLENDYFKDKIILIGSTALDLRSNLNDNFTDLFGNSIPGVMIHANIVNSYLARTFYTEPNNVVIVSLLLAFIVVLSEIYRRIKRISLTFVAFILASLLVLIITLIVIDQGILIPFVTLFFVLLVHYIFTVVYKYTTQSKETRYVKTVFSRYLNKHLLNVLLEDTSKLKLGGETKNMSVLFSDIRSFTTISEQLTSEELINMLNDYLGYMTEIILKNNGIIDKYIGDAIMAFWNAPLNDDLHAVNAIKAALAMKESLENFRNLHPEYPTINIGIGINSGTMTVGNVGGADRFDYTILGDNVNLGSRLEGLTKKYGVVVLVSEFTHAEYLKEIKGKDSEIKFRLLDEAKVKGKETGIKFYEPYTDLDSDLVMKYESAFILYQSGEFEKAAKILRGIEDKDQPSHKLLERIESMDEELKKNWNGVWKWEEK